MPLHIFCRVNFKKSKEAPGSTLSNPPFPPNTPLLFLILQIKMLYLKRAPLISICMDPEKEFHLHCNSSTFQVIVYVYRNISVQISFTFSFVVNNNNNNPVFHYGPVSTSSRIASHITSSHHHVQERRGRFFGSAHHVVHISFGEIQQGNSDVWDLIVDTAVQVTKKSRNSEAGGRDGGRWCRNVTFFRRNVSYNSCFQLIRRSRQQLQVPRTPCIHFWSPLLVTLSRGRV